MQPTLLGQMIAEGIPNTFVQGSQVTTGHLHPVGEADRPKEKMPDGVFAITPFHQPVSERV
jgi:hypothetical protein